MPNRATYPTGNAFLVETPKSDRFLNQLYVEQQQRDALRQREDADLDKLLQAEIGKTRSVDQPEIINQYQQYKALKKQLLSDKKLQRDPIAYNQLKSQADRLQQGILTTGKGSSEQSERTKGLVEAWRRNPDAFAPDFAQRIAAIQNTPVSIMDKHPIFGDLRSDEKLIYSGPDYDFTGMLQKAKGEKRLIGSTKVPVGKEGFQDDVTETYFHNTPEQVKSSLIEGMSQKKAERSAAALWDGMSKEAKEKIINDYKAIPLEKWHSMGLDGPEDLMPKNPQSRAESWASIKAMEYAVQAQPEIVQKRIDNKEAQWNAKKLEDRIMENIKDGNAKDRIRLNKELSAKPEEEQASVMEGVYNKLIDDSKANTPKGKEIDVVLPGGKYVKGYKVPAAPQYEEAFSRTVDGSKISQDDLIITEDGTVVPIYYKRKIETDPKTGKKTVGDFERDAEGTKIVDYDLTKPVSKSQGMAVLGGKLLTKAANKTELQLNNGGKKEKKSTKKGEFDDLE